MRGSQLSVATCSAALEHQLAYRPLNWLLCVRDNLQLLKQSGPCCTSNLFWPRSRQLTRKRMMHT